MIAKTYGKSVNVPFTGMLPEILDFTKEMTTRLDEKLHYYNTFIHFDQEKHGRDRPWLHMFWRNARTRHPEFYKMGIVEWWGGYRKKGTQLTLLDAILDGFGKYGDDALYAYKEALAHTNNIDMVMVDRLYWTQLLWEKDGWIEGPFKPPEGNPAWKWLPRKVA